MASSNVTNMWIAGWTSDNRIDIVWRTMTSIHWTIIDSVPAVAILGW